ncbi:MAG TPA: hypothetical protein VF478_03750 [Anaerolineae bacterium]
MNNKRLIGLVGLAVAALVILACDAGTFVAMVNPPTPTPSRTPRPTFTPRPAETETPQPSPTPAAADTPDASPTPTKRAVNTVRPATPKPVATVPPPPPKLAWTVKSNDGTHGKCPTGAPVYEIKGRVFAGSDYLGGVHLVLIDHSGKIVTQGNSWGRDEMNLEFGVSCFEEKSLFNYQLDGTAGWSNGPLTLRLTNSAGDLTAISPDTSISWDASGGRYYIDFVK